MRERRYKPPAVDDAFGWQGFLRRDVVRALKDEIREVDVRRCIATPPSIHKVIMIHGLLQRVEDICVQLDREWNSKLSDIRERLVLANNASEREH
jgi:hypothetical protein